MARSKRGNGPKGGPAQREAGGSLADGPAVTASAATRSDTPTTSASPSVAPDRAQRGSGFRQGRSSGRTVGRLRAGSRSTKNPAKRARGASPDSRWKAAIGALRPDAVALFAASFGCALMYEPVFAGWGVLVFLALAALAALAISVGLAKRLRGWGTVLASAAAMVLWLTIFVGSDGIGLQVPTPGALFDSLAALRNSVVKLLSVPVPTVATRELLAGPLMFTWVSTHVAGSLSRVRSRRALVLLPLLVAFVVAVFLTSPLRIASALGTVLFLAGSAFWFRKRDDRMESAGRVQAQQGGLRIVGEAIGSRFAGLGKMAGGLPAIASALTVVAVVLGSIGLSAWRGRNNPDLRKNRIPPVALRVTKSPLADVYPQLTGAQLVSGEGESDTAFSVTTTAERLPRYLRVVALDRFDGETWRASRDFVPIGQTTPVRQQSERLHATVTMRADSQAWLPTLGIPLQVSLPDLAYDEDTETVAAIDGLDTGTNFDVDFAQLPLSADAEPVDDPGPEPSKELLSVPAPVETGSNTTVANSEAAATCAVEDIAGLANNLASADGTSFARLQTIERHMKTEYRRSLEFGPGAGITQLCRALGRGTYTQKAPAQPEQFASAMALMGRVLQIPTRVVVGYRLDANPGVSAEVGIGQAHAWVEAWTPERGWVAFDPTPDQESNEPQPTPIASSPIPPAEDIENPTTTSPETTSPSTTAANSGEGGIKGSDGPQIPWKLLLTPILLAGLLFGLPIGLILVIKARRLAKRRDDPDDRRATIGALDSVVSIYRDFGAQVALADTNTELLDRLEAIIPEDTKPEVHRPLRALANAASAAQYSSAPVLNEQSELAWQHHNEAVNWLRLSHPTLDWWKGRVSLRSFRKVPANHRLADEERGGLDGTGPRDQGHDTGDGDSPPLDDGPGAEAVHDSDPVTTASGTATSDRQPRGRW